MEQENDVINHPQHYAGFSATIECIDITRHLSFDYGNAFKYVWRAGKKGDKAKAIEDLNKAAWYLQDIRENGIAADNRTALVVARLIVTTSDTLLEGYRCQALNAILAGNLETAEENVWRMVGVFES